MTMPTKSRILGILVVILLATNVAMLVFFVFLKPQPPQKQGKGRGGYDVAVILEKEVGFSKQQMDTYNHLREQHWEKMKPSFMAMRTAKDSFYQQLYLDGVADSVVNRYGDTIAYRQKSIDMQIFRHFQQVRGLCTDEQRPRFDSLVNQVIRKMSGPYRRDKGERPDSTHSNHKP
ncbi:hypothetical protein MKQ68_04575 [Chitinophaga horti]|uniref:Periplasmic heavy metal sensor n=1 Tax=Chitinophaga horti TaxID=2920382 RepID=A0ABY6J444_9BACT|nr:hypothetical protein [Chitinophaga horti]UYQ94363.1 hypothetical protein MKQ68_04575 [Chitinophaga horti]